MNLFDELTFPIDISFNRHFNPFYNNSFQGLSQIETISKTIAKPVFWEFLVNLVHDLCDELAHILDKDTKAGS